VKGVFDDLKTRITNIGGEIFDEEAPERIDLAYPIVKGHEGKNRKYASAYFGWVRFRLAGELFVDLREELLGHAQVLRALLVKLTRMEEVHPYKFHAERKSVKVVRVVDEAVPVLAETRTESEADVEVSEEALEESLERITGEKEEEVK
jgi:ribosomal protein S6